MAATSATGKTAGASCDVSQIDQSEGLDPVGRLAAVSETDDFTGPIDEILALIQNAYEKRIKISAKDMQLVDKKVHEMKNRIINQILSKGKKEPVEVKRPHVNEQDNFITKDMGEWPPLQFNDRSRGKSRSSVIVKCDSDKKLMTSEVSTVEGEISEMLSLEGIDATILSSSSTKTGDVVIKFKESDNVQNIAKKVKSNLGYETRSRPSFLPKMTISYVPKYTDISTKDSLTASIINSNNWLEGQLQLGESFEVLFTYKVKDWGSIVCKVSPGIRAEIILRGNSIKIQNRSCPMKDRFHIIQCGNCLQFGHKTHACRKNVIVCTHCGEDHRWKDCPHKDEKEKLCCSNCRSSRDNDSSNIDSIKHGARSHECPMYLRQLKHQIEMTNWGYGPVPKL